ncbi:calpain family cysteine protease-like protein [Leishmania infantum JPCM5]|uniref:Calpain_family_cysteine_protease-like_protein n=2 Tax=Leishmania infantum TaxID=5671 RepID=A0A6L0XG39_LEIIN|nr:calpain family cysteine protease-like protein [Leishmania infantum JPCM5]CAC9494513.1 calpain_family_cysteine_protease-like_protein [Leishmania infantum]CAM68624.1 calpain family cysteine protease-like protein [Leishmania infantum JPCM5]SUZ42483.1 calpain_family_cysteine_protease-like_protein [Leishmania infantum]|eukprot:XP_001466185.1 calpain family cysteine protease-like protein [Leishmania infantum JPCM5]
MGNGCCGCCDAKPEYKLGRPLVSGKTTPCFNDGRLFKIVKGDIWYFYNDTQDYQMKVTADFGNGSNIVAMSDTELVCKNDSGACTATVSVFPLETKAMVKTKEVNGFNVKYSGIAFTDAYRQKLRQKAAAQVSADLAEMRKLRERNPKVNNQNRLLKVARTKGKMYVDTSFPPTSQSLIRPGIDPDPDACLKRPETIAWRRPEDFLPKKWHPKIRLFGNISPKDISQGQLGDCYYLCALAALAEHDAAIKGIFKNRHGCCIRSQERKHGAWRVNLNISGWWRTIIIDSYLPSVQLLPVFARNRNHPNELWVSFAEKAYAKVFGSYQAIVAGYPWQALEDLTGFPAYDFGNMWRTAQTDTDTRKKLFDSLHWWNEKKYLICIATPSNGALKMAGKQRSANQLEALFEKAGLNIGHAYSVLDVKHFPLHRLCMLKIRNPWGSHVEWTGDWGDDSPLWNRYPFIKLACRPQKKADGIFWMEWRDVSKFFDSGSVCFRRGHWFRSWYDYRVIGSFEDLVCDTALLIIVNKTSQFPAYISLHQKDCRGLPTSDPDSKYACVMISISEGDINGSQQKVVANSSENPEEPSTEYLFQESRSVSLYYKFTKAHKYLVIPRRMKSSTGNNVPKKKYVIALRTQTKVSSEDVVVNIVRLDKNNAVFKNVASFDAGTPTSLNTLYQIKDGNNVFRTYRSDNLRKGKKQHNAEFELVM